MQVRPTRGDRVKTVRWIVAAFNTVAWAFRDALLCVRDAALPVPEAPATVVLPVVSDGRRTPVKHWGIGDGSEFAETCRAAAADLAETREIEVVPAKLNGGHAALLEDTGEYPIVLVSLDRREPKSRKRTDELGEWDPSAVDWTATASIYESTVEDTWGGWTRTILEEDRPGIALDIAERVLCGAGTK
jgi:hypothetical protein